jgi:dipeptidyl aminopeptidase/acylaminoacyl peptidase
MKTFRSIGWTGFPAKPRVPFSEAVQIAAKVRGNGRSVWTVYADNEGHGFVRRENRDYLEAVMAMFLPENLKGTGP